MQRNKLLKILVSAVIAFVLWVYVISVVSPGSEKTYYNIPVTFQNENVLAERNLIITEYDESVTLKLQGNRTDLNAMDENNINILANVSGIAAPGVHKINYDISLPGNIASDAVVTNSKSLDMITVKVENLVTKKVKVEYVATGTLPQDYYPEDPVYSSNGQVITEVQVSGPHSMVSQIEYAVIHVDMANRTESIGEDMEYTLCDKSRHRVDVDPELVTTDVQTIRMDMKIHRYMELPLAVELIEGGGATKDNCIVTISPIEKLTVSGEEKVMKDLKSLVIGSVNLAELEDDVTLTLPLTMPEGVINRTEGYQEVEVKIQLKDLDTTKLTVNQFRITNKPQGMMYEGIPSSMTVELRGPKDQIRKIKASDVTIVVDLKNTQAGVNPVQLKLEFADGFDAVGVLSKTEIVVSLKAQ